MMKEEMSCSFQMAKLSMLVAVVVLLHLMLISGCANAEYKTFELVEYCQGFDSKVKFPNESLNDDIRTDGLVVPKKYTLHHQRFVENGINDNQLSADNNPDYDDGPAEDDTNNEDYAGKIVTVDTEYDNSAIRLRVDRENVFRARMRCPILVMPKKPNGLIVTLRKFHVRPGIDWLRISINNSSFTRTFSHIRINGERDSVAYVAHHGVLIEFGTKAYLSKSESVEIELILTSFREADLCDIDSEFDCGSFRCISNYLVCDGFNNCGDGRDETNCPMDNIANYLIISTTLLLAAFSIFLCFCYRCCFQKQRNRYSPLHKNSYQYLKIRANSQPTPFMPKFRSHSIQSEADLPSNRSVNNPQANNNNLRALKYAHVGDSLPVLLPNKESPSSFNQNSGYGSIGRTYFVPYQPYTIALNNNRANRLGLIPFQPSASRSVTAETIPEHHTFPLPQPQTYPILHPQLFTPPPSHTPPPPPYTPRDPQKSPPSSPDKNN